MNQIRNRFTYANVMSSLAVFLLLGGATAFAALGKNSVGTKQLKKNAVTTAKIKKNAVTTAKIKNNAVTTAKIQDNAVTGAKVDEATLGQVPNAAAAGSAAAVNGVSFSKFNERSAGGTAEKDVFNNGHLRVTFECDATGKITIKGYTLTDHASIESYGNSGDTNVDDFNVAGSPETLSSSDEQRDVVYSDESGILVHLTYLAEEERPSGPKCVFAGFAEVQ